MAAITPITGLAAGVPFLALPPANGPRDSAPLVITWHQLDPPRTESAFAAAIPMTGLDAWRVYLGLPLSGARLPDGGQEELMRRAFDDGVLKLQEPVVIGAAEEFPAALGALRAELGIMDAPIGVVGASAGAAAAMLALAENDVAVQAAVFINPMVRLRAAVDSLAARYSAPYTWTEQTEAVARRLDFVARAPDVVTQSHPAILVIVGANDDRRGFIQPALAFRDALAGRYAGSGRLAFESVPDMGHALADEPGDEPAPQTSHARDVDRRVVTWLRRHLINPAR